ncbi:MAG TPA: metallophosphoesterase [Gemmataceae bacterium]|nr:metallophosphoesterase [Gemmataceae bacterium]
MQPQATQPASQFRTYVRCGALLALLVTAYTLIVNAAVRPLHAAGCWQQTLDYLNGLAAVLGFPGDTVYYRIQWLAFLRLPAAEVVMLVVNVAFYFTAGFVLRFVWDWATRPPRSLAAMAQQPHRGISRRGFLARGVQALGAGSLAGLGYGLAVEPRRFEVTRRTIYLRDLPRSLDGLCVVQVTDLHHGPWVSLERIREVVDATNALNPDLVLLTGDYIDQNAAYIPPVVAELARLRPRIGTVAVLGNHDWFEDGPLAQREFARAGIPLIDNDRLVLTPQRRLVQHAGQGLALCGVGDLKEDQQDYGQALGGLPARMPRVLLSHNPDVAEETGLTDSGLRVDLIVSGHTHGGQIRLPFIGTPVTQSRYGQKYCSGLVQGPVCPVFICRGVGVSGLPIRLGVAPELAVLVFRTASAQG